MFSLRYIKAFLKQSEKRQLIIQKIYNHQQGYLKKCDDFNLLCFTIV